MRTKNKPITANLDGTRIKKIASKALARWRKDRVRLMLNLEINHDRTPGEGINRRVMQAATGRALDGMQIFEKEKRARIHKMTQAFAKDKSQEYFEKNFMPALAKELGPDGAGMFVRLLSLIQAPNSTRARALYQKLIAQDSARDRTRN